MRGRFDDDLIPGARHVLEQYANNTVETDHDRLKARLRPMRAMKTISSLRVLAVGHAFARNLRRGRYELSGDQPTRGRVQAAFCRTGPLPLTGIPARHRRSPAAAPSNNATVPTNGLTEKAPTSA